MSVNRPVWKTAFHQNSFPGLPCPQCNEGKLKLVVESFYKDEPVFSKKLYSEEAWEPQWITARFNARLQCDENNCGEIVIISGDTEIVDVDLYDEFGRHTWGQEEILRPRTVFPAPPLFRIPENVPSAIKQQIYFAFQFFWTDLETSVGRLRTAVELILNDHKIASEKITPNGSKPRNLFERIELFASKVDEGSKEALHGLRHIGNLGTHGNAVSKEAFFDSLDVFEDILLGIYEKKSIKLKIKKLNDNKGKY